LKESDIEQVGLTLASTQTDEEKLEVDSVV
jgi:hypothetical protein